MVYVHILLSFKNLIMAGLSLLKSCKEQLTFFPFFTLSNIENPNVNDNGYSL